MLNAGAVIAKFKADITDLKSGVSQAKGLMGTLTSTAQKVGSGMSKTFASVGGGMVSVLGSAVTKAGSLIMQGFQKAGQFIVNTFTEAVSQAKIASLAIAGFFGLAFKQGIQVAGDMQQISLALETITGSAEKAREAMKGIKEDAKKTPFDLRDVARANQALMSTGLTADESRKAVLDLGNAIVASGGGNAEFSRMVFNLQQVRNLGKASAMDIRQFGMAGINIFALLEKSTGKTKAELEGMDVTYEMLTEALSVARAEGGLYAGALDKQANSWNLVKSNLKDVVNIMLGDLVTSTGIFGLMNQGLIKLVNYLTVASDKIQFFMGLLNGDYNGELGKALGIFEDDEIVTKWLAMGDALRGFIELIQTDDIMNFGEAMKTLGFSDETINKFGVFAGYLRDFGTWVAENKDYIFDFLKGMAIGLGGLLIVGSLALAFSALTNPIFLVITAIGLLYTAWTNNFMGIKDFTSQAISFLTDLFNKHKDELQAIWNAISNIIKGFVAVIMFIWDRFGDNIIGAFRAWWDIIIGVLRFAIAIIAGVINAFSALIQGDWDAFWNAIRVMAKTGADAIVQIIQGMVDLALNAIDILVSLFTKKFTALWDKAREIANKIRETISKAFDVDKRNSPSIRDRLNDVKAVTEGILGSIVIPSFSSDIASALATATPNIGNIALSGEPAGQTIVQQTINATISDSLDVDTLSERLAFNARNNL